MIPPERLESKTIVLPPKQIDTAIMFEIFE